MEDTDKDAGSWFSPGPSPLSQPFGEGPGDGRFLPLPLPVCNAAFEIKKKSKIFFRKALVGIMTDWKGQAQNHCSSSEQEEMCVFEMEFVGLNDKLGDGERSLDRLGDSRY